MEDVTVTNEMSQLNRHTKAACGIKIFHIALVFPALLYQLVAGNTFSVGISPNTYFFKNSFSKMTFPTHKV